MILGVLLVGLAAACLSTLWLPTLTGVLVVLIALVAAAIIVLVELL